MSTGGYDGASFSSVSTHMNSRRSSVSVPMTYERPSSFIPRRTSPSSASPRRYSANDPYQAPRSSPIQRETYSGPYRSPYNHDRTGSYSSGSPVSPERYERPISFRDSGFDARGRSASWRSANTPSWQSSTSPVTRDFSSERVDSSSSTRMFEPSESWKQSHERRRSESTGPPDRPSGLLEDRRARPTVATFSNPYAGSESYQWNSYRSRDPWEASTAYRERFTSGKRLPPTSPRRRSLSDRRLSVTSGRSRSRSVARSLRSPPRSRSRPTSVRRDSDRFQDQRSFERGRSLTRSNSRADSRHKRSRSRSLSRSSIASSRASVDAAQQPSVSPDVSFSIKCHAEETKTLLISTEGASPEGPNLSKDNSTEATKAVSALDYAHLDASQSSTVVAGSEISSGNSNRETSKTRDATVLNQATPAVPASAPVTVNVNEDVQMKPSQSPDPPKPTGGDEEAPPWRVDVIRPMPLPDFDVQDIRQVIEEGKSVRNSVRAVVMTRLLYRADPARDVKVRDELIRPLLERNTARAASMGVTVDRSKPTTDALIKEVASTERCDVRFTSFAASTIREPLVKRLEIEEEARLEKIRRLQVKYQSCYDKWMAHCASLDQRAKAPTHEVEVVAPAGRTTRRTANLGDVIRSDLEMEQIIASIGNDEATDPVHLSMRNIASIPDMVSVQKGSVEYIYDNTNLRVRDPVEYYAPRTGIDDWTDDEKEIFLDKFAAYPKQFGIIASFLPHKTAPQCVAYYYLHKKHAIDFRKVVSTLAPNKRRRGKRADKKKGNALLTDIMQHDAEVSRDTGSPAHGTRGRSRASKQDVKAAGRKYGAQVESTPPAATPTPEPDPRSKRKRVSNTFPGPGQSNKVTATLDEEKDASVETGERPCKKPKKRKFKSAEFVEEFDTFDGFSVPVKTASSNEQWSFEDKALFMQLLAQHGNNFEKIATAMNKTPAEVRSYHKGNVKNLPTTSDSTSQDVPETRGDSASSITSASAPSLTSQKTPPMGSLPLDANSQDPSPSASEIDSRPTSASPYHSASLRTTPWVYPPGPSPLSRPPTADFDRGRSYYSAVRPPVPPMYNTVPGIKYVSPGYASAGRPYPPYPPYSYSYRPMASSMQAYTNIEGAGNPILSATSQPNPEPNNPYRGSGYYYRGP